MTKRTNRPTRSATDKPRPSNLKPQSANLCEAEIIPGLERFAQEEMIERFGTRLQFQPSSREDTQRFRYTGHLGALLGLRSVVAVFVAHTFAVPRPRALLGVEHFTALLALVDTVRGLHRPPTFTTLRISAAGEESSVLTRLKTELAARAGLTPTEEEAELLLRLRRAPGPDVAWEVLARLSPRPLTARAWRVCNMPGALNAVIAHAMARLTHPTPTDRYLNLACGSGTLLIERLALGPAALTLGCDRDPAALACAAQNLQAARVPAPAPLIQADITRLPLPDGAVDVLTADLPFGQMIGSHSENERLYPLLLAEAARVAAPAARMVLVTHEIRLLERLLDSPPTRAAWATDEILRLKLPFKSGGLNPRIYCLRRVTGDGG
jgi:tRNA (guanine6-N2)-methyltransferase